MFRRALIIICATLFITTAWASSFTPQQQELNETYGITSPSSLHSKLPKSQEVLDRTKKTVQNENVTVPVKDYALKYYQAWMQDKNELHYIVNFHVKTVTSIAKIGNSLMVIVHEWQKGTEHYIDTIGSGMVLGTYMVDLGTGEIVKIN